MKRKYIYDGAVVSFGNVLSHNWHGATYAVSTKQAINNLVFQFKKSMGLVVNTQVKLVGMPVIEEAD